MTNDTRRCAGHWNFWSREISSGWRLNADIEIFLRKEVIQPQVPLRLPCYDFTPVTSPTVAVSLLAVSETS